GEPGRWLARHVLVLDVGKIKATGDTKCVPAPGTDVDVKQFVLAVAGILLELNLHHARSVHMAQQTLSRFKQFRQIHRLDKAAAQAIIYGILTKASRRHRLQHLAIGAERRYGDLARSPARDDLLH